MTESNQVANVPSAETPHTCELDIIKNGAMYTVYQCNKCKEQFPSFKENPSAIEDTEFCHMCGRKVV